MARNIYYGGSVFFLLVLIGLTVNTVKSIPKTDNRENLSEQVVHGILRCLRNGCANDDLLRYAYHARPKKSVF